MTRYTVIALLLLFLLPSSAAAQVSFDRLLRADEEPENWLTYSGSYKSQRHSQLDQITPANVTDLELRWVFQARSLEVFQATPLVVDGIMYLVEPTNTVVAIDATLGRVFWTYEYTPSRAARPCCGAVNRGLGMLGNTLFLATVDANLVALDATSGKPLWKTAVGDPAEGYALTLAPLVIKDKVVVGIAGG
ncbi:MAG: PQQ-binding-like beta-propeller repeat protein, partial [Vicinamibacterales bacterium]